MKGLTPLSLLAGMLAAVPFAWSQEQDVSSFLQQAAEGNVAETELAEVAQERAASEDVKMLSRRIQSDHELANERLESIAEEKDADLPDEPSEQHQQLNERLSELEGEKFDRQYLQTMIEEHKKTIQQFEQQAKTAQDPQVRQYAEQTLPALRSHLEEAQLIQKQAQEQPQQQEKSQQR